MSPETVPHPLNPALRAVLVAAIDRIIPADDYPSASQAGTDGFIIGLLNRELREEAAGFLSALNALDEEAIATLGRPFARLVGEQQDQILAAFESGTTKTPFPRAAAFFKQLVELTMEGYYSNPGNGGNRDALSWKMIDYRPKAQLRNQA